MITIFIICDYNDVPQPRHRTVDTHCSVQLLWVQCKHEVIILIIVWHMDCITHYNICSHANTQFLHFMSRILLQAIHLVHIIWG